MSNVLNDSSLPLAQATCVLVAGDESSLSAIRALVHVLPESARGQIFIEVPRLGDIETMETPERVTVTWLARETRSGNPGTCEPCRPGQALGRAVCAWLSEMCTGDQIVDDAELPTIWIDGDLVLASEARSRFQALTSRP